MTDIGKPERATQNRVIKLFVDELGYRYLGDWSDQDANSNVDDGLPTSCERGRLGSIDRGSAQPIVAARSPRDN
jgi:type I restriction enzyme R subunit